MNIDARIIFLVAVPDIEPSDATFLQGFSPSLCKHPEVFDLLARMPSTIFEFSVEDPDVRIAMKMSGSSPVWWAPLSPSSICGLPIHDTQTFVVLIVLPGTDVREFGNWKSKFHYPPLVVGTANGDVTFDEFSLGSLKEYCIKTYHSLKQQNMITSDEWTADKISKWSPLVGRNIGYKVDGHNAFAPNLMALQAAGFEITSGQPFTPPNNNGDAQYIAELVRTSNSILDERDRIGPREANKIFRPTIDVMLFAPSIYSHLKKKSIWHDEHNPEIARRVADVIQGIVKQKGYRYEASPKKLERLGFNVTEQGMQVHPLLRMRIEELRLQSNVVGLLAASEFSAVLRLPNRINLTGGQIRQFAAHKRGSRGRDRKRMKAFSEVQTRLKEAFPQEFLPILKRSRNGIRIISDIPLEWLDVDGVPLGLRFNTTRLPTTPGNLLIGHLAAMNPIYLEPSAFSDILVISALEDKDPIRPLFEHAFGAFDGISRNKVNIRFAEVGSRKDLVRELNSFEGVFMVFDGHGSHEPDEAANLWLKGEKIDVWSLKTELRRIPPIVFLSACDTHAADRNHATTGSGFLRLGARTALSSYFPLDAREAAAFAARLIYRISDFIPAAINTFDRAITWNEVVGGMLRMTFVTDFLRRLESEGVISDDDFEKLGAMGNYWINSGDADPFLQMKNALIEKGIDEAAVSSRFKETIATTSALSLVQLGRPETIFFDTTERQEKQGMRLANAQP